MTVPDRLATNLCGIPLRNPILAASGSCAYGIEFARLVDWSKVGGLIVKGLSREPVAGNPPPRLYETEGGMINSIGLQNVGVRAFVRDKLPDVRKLETAPVLFPDLQLPNQLGTNLFVVPKFHLWIFAGLSGTAGTVRLISEHQKSCLGLQSFGEHQALLMFRTRDQDSYRWSKPTHCLCLFDTDANLRSCTHL